MAICTEQLMCQRMKSHNTLKLRDVMTYICEMGID